MLVKYKNIIYSLSEFHDLIFPNTKEISSKISQEDGISISCENSSSTSEDYTFDDETNSHLNNKTNTKPKISTNEKILWNKANFSSMLPSGYILCTNNIESKNNEGCMTHLYVGKLKKIIKSKKYIDRHEIQCIPHPSFDFHNLGPVRNVEYWAVIPDILKGVNVEYNVDMKLYSAPKECLQNRIGISSKGGDNEDHCYFSTIIKIYKHFKKKLL